MRKSRGAVPLYCSHTSHNEPYLLLRGLFDYRSKRGNVFILDDLLRAEQTRRSNVKISLRRSL